MQNVKWTIRIFLVVVVFGLIGWALIANYSYVFSRKVVGVVDAVERIPVNVSLMQGQGPVDPKVFSFGVAIRTSNGEIVTASAEDRQWSVVQKGECVEATYYPYPPWYTMKGGTYFNARLDRLYDCPK